MSSQGCIEAGAKSGKTSPCVVQIITISIRSQPHRSIIYHTAMWFLLQIQIFISYRITQTLAIQVVTVAIHQGMSDG